MNKRLFFENKKCDFCKRKAIIFRIIGNKTYMLCDSKKCDKLSRIREGFFISTLNHLRN